jgi:16S rRNA processing protein RimM
VPAVATAPGRVETPVVVGRICGAFGTRGWVKVVSYTRPKGNLLEYRPWLLGGDAGWRSCQILDAGRSGSTLIVYLDAATTRTAAQGLVGLDIAIRRDQLPVLPAGQYYWSDLVGMRVVDIGGRAFGYVTGLIETGANDVLEVQGAPGRLLIPFVPGPIVDRVDMDAGEIRVRWDPEYI